MWAAEPPDDKAALARAAVLRDVCSQDVNLGVQAVGPIQVRPPGCDDILHGASFCPASECDAPHSLAGCMCKVQSWCKGLLR